MENEKERLVRVTSSRLDKVFMGANTKGHQDYISEKVSEILTGHTHFKSSKQTQWGEDHEEEAVICCANTYGVQIDYQSDLFISHNEYFGGSPDGEIEGKITLEVKCPYNPSVHQAVVVNNSINNKGYELQLQGNMLVQNNDYGLFWSYCAYTKNGFGIIIEKDELIQEQILEKSEIAQKEIMRQVDMQVDAYVKSHESIKDRIQEIIK